MNTLFFEQLENKYRQAADLCLKIRAKYVVLTELAPEHKNIRKAYVGEALDLIVDLERTENEIEALKMSQCEPVATVEGVMVSREDCVTIAEAFKA
jgi:hypothetical protein